MGRFAMRLAGCAVAVMISAPAVLVVGGGIGTVATAGAASPCPAGQPSGAAPGRQGGSSPGRPSAYPMGQCQLQLSRGFVPRGGSVTVTGYGFPAGAHVVITIGDTTLGSATADASGSFSADETIPASLAPGTYTVTASGGGQALGAQLVVTGDGAAPGSAAAALTSGGSSGGTSGGGSSPAASAAQSAAQGAAAQPATGGSISSPGSGSGGVSHAVAPATLNHTTSTSALAWIALGALVLLVMAGGLLLMMRRRSGTSAS